MTEEKVFKIREIKRYTDEFDEKNREIANACLLICTTMLCHQASIEKNLPDFTNIVFYASYLLHTYVIGQSFVERTKLKAKIDLLKEQFGPMYEQYLNEYKQEYGQGRNR